MSKFNKAARNDDRHTSCTGATPATYEGGPAYARDPRSELVLLAAVNMGGEETFYEKSGDRDDRFARLVRSVAVADGEWTAQFITWLRGAALMRTASLVAAAEAVHARLAAGLHGGNRQLVDAACLRADEPGEFLAYWTGTFGRALPKPVKRGVGDAVRRLYGERSLLKYDTGSHAYRFGDVLELTHPAPDPAKPWQGELFRHALDRRHGGRPGRVSPAESVPSALPTVRAHAELMALPVVERQLLPYRDGAAEVLRQAGMTWEALAGWLQGPMDAAAWEAVLPSMGLMAQLRNLRNFDEAGISPEAAQQVLDRLTDPEEIARSRQFPFRFLAAYRAAPSPRWGNALDAALTAATANVPRLPGRTLVLVDASGSMLRPVSARSTVRHVDIGILFGAALAHRGCEVDLFGFADRHFPHRITPGGSVLRDIEAFCERIGEAGHGTQTTAALRATYAGHDRVVVVSDMQAFPDSTAPGPRRGRRGDSPSDAVPAHVPLFGVNTTGYAPASIDTSRPNRYEIGGFSDKLFTMIDWLSAGPEGQRGWPWETAAAD